jgi:hypothetical protein
MALPPEKDFGERLQSLFAFDCVRLSRILETAQYAILFGLIALVFGYAVDALFKPLYPQPTRECREEKLFTGGQCVHVVLVALLQVAVSAVLVIYLRKLGQLAPVLLQPCPDKYVPHFKVTEFESESALALCYVGIQTSFIEALALLRKSAFVHCP